MGIRGRSDSGADVRQAGTGVRTRRDQAPAARRLRTAGLGDLRLWLGIALVVVAMIVGASVMTAGSDTVLVMRAGHDLSVGSVPVDLVPVAVNRTAAGDAYLPGDLGSGDPTAGAVLVRPVRAGELVPRSALGPPVSEPMRQVTVPVDPVHAPPGLRAGDLVDVWASAPATSAEPSRVPRTVVRDVTVVAVSAESLGVGGELAVVLAVAEDAVADLVAASRASVVDLVAVPVDSQLAST